MKCQHRKLNLRWCALGVAWFGATVVVWSALLQHAYQPAIIGDVAMEWPTGAQDDSPSAGFQIVLFAHPFCPCTRATLHKLDESLTRLPSNTSIRVIFETSGLPKSAVDASLNVSFAQRLPRVEVLFDESGMEARRFGATVSGEVFAFDKGGPRRFHGGLTAGRGHQGDSAGQQQLERLACGSCDDSYDGPVFGCPLPLAIARNDT